jgi:hypothetical protein
VAEPRGGEGLAGAGGPTSASVRCFVRQPYLTRMWPASARRICSAYDAAGANGCRFCSISRASAATTG